MKKTSQLFLTLYEITPTEFSKGKESKYSNRIPIKLEDWKFTRGLITNKTEFLFPLLYKSCYIEGWGIINGKGDPIVWGKLDTPRKFDPFEQPFFSPNNLKIHILKHD